MHKRFLSTFKYHVNLHYKSVKIGGMNDQDVFLALFLFILGFAMYFLMNCKPMPSI